MKKRLLNVGFLTLATCMHSAFAADHSVTVEGASVRFVGKITQQAASDIQRYLEKDIKQLTITSEGGDAAAALSIAKALRARHIEVVVEGYCISACANYLFLGAERKRINPGALLGFHGGLYAVPRPNASGAAPNSALTKVLGPDYASLLRESDAFYKAIGLDDSLIARSYELTKPGTPSILLKVQARGQTFTFTGKEEGLAFIDELVRNKEKYTFELEYGAISSNKVYFPRLERLQAAGSKGITGYPYPATRHALAQIGKRVSDDLIVIGDDE